MICEYCEIGSYYGTCMCSRDGQICPFMRRCPYEKCWLPLDNMDVCRLRKEGVDMSHLKKGEYIVTFERGGKLYVDIDGMMHKFVNPFDDIPKVIEVVKVDGEYYIRGFEPQEEKKQTPKPKKKKNKEGK